MRLIKGNILGVLQSTKEGNAIKKGSLYILEDSNVLRYDTVLVKDIDKDKVKNIKEGDIVHIHKGVGQYLNNEELIFKQGHIIYAD